MSQDIRPFRIDIPEADLEDLRRRLRQTRWPDSEPVDDWSQGIPLSYTRDLCEHWLRSYDWRASEASLNRFPAVPDRNRRPDLRLRRQGT
jgi:Epoxide hydrolase N terminus